MQLRPTRVLPAMPDAAGDGGMRADDAVVADLNLIVELGALFDDRVVHRTAIDGGVRADLDIVGDDDPADLGDLDPASLILGEPEAVGPDHDAGMHDAVRTDLAVDDR